MIYLLIPSYNDSDNFNQLLWNIKKTLKGEKIKIIIVNDGSTDNTKKTAKALSKKYPLSIIGYKKNKGPGYAFRYGFEYLISKLKEQDLVITMEADNSSDLSILKKMINSCRYYDLVLSSPFAKRGKFVGLEKNRKFLSNISSFLDARVFRIKGVKTYASFYRAYRASILIKAFQTYKKNLITEYGFSSVIELLIKLSKIEASIKEIPATLDWRLRSGKSKMKILKTITRQLIVYKNYLFGKYNL